MSVLQRCLASLLSAAFLLTALPAAATPPDTAPLAAPPRLFGSGAPLGSLLRRQLQQLPSIPHVTTRRGLAVIVDFQNSRLEDWSGPGFNDTGEVRDMLARMAAHWRYLSHRTEDMQWDLVRLTLPVELSPTAFAGWPEFRNTVGALLRQRVDVRRYDADRDGVIDSAWIITASRDREYDYLIGGTSRNAGVNMFVDGQADLSVVSGAYGNFNHELGHTLGLPDLYGSYDTLHYLTLMSDSWPVPPQDFTAYERSLLGWLRPRELKSGSHHVRLRRADRYFEAVRIPTGRANEFFLIEYRRRPDSGFGSSAPFYDGLAVYHLLEGSNQWQDPPLMKLVAADGYIAPNEAPDFFDFLYPGNPYMKQPLRLRSYFGNAVVASIDNVQWGGDGSLEFDVRVLPGTVQQRSALILRNLLRNGSFERGSGATPAAWDVQQFNAGARFEWENDGTSGRRSVSVTATTPNDARWVQTVNGLTPGRSYELCGNLKGRDIATGPGAAVGGNVAVEGGFVSSPGRAGSFDWTRTCLIYQPLSSSDTFACRLGFYGSTVTGTLWCDDMTLLPLESAFN